MDGYIKDIYGLEEEPSSTSEDYSYSNAPKEKSQEEFQESDDENWWKEGMPIINFCVPCRVC